MFLNKNRISLAAKALRTAADESDLAAKHKIIDFFLKMHFTDFCTICKKNESYF